MPGKGINGRANMQKFQMNSKKYGGNPFKYTSLVSSVGRASKGGMWNSIQSRTAVQKPGEFAGGLTDLNFKKAIDWWLAGGSYRDKVISELGAIGNWNTSVVTDMRDAFANGRQTSLGGNLNSSTFNEDIGNWDTSSVIDMSFMFAGAAAFNQNISTWITAAVQYMSYMFFDAAAFIKDISGWDTAAVTNMRHMFHDAAAFNQNINGWNTALVKNMSNMFYGAAAFNQDISGWNTAAVTNMNSMFYSSNQNHVPFNNGGAAGTSTIPLTWNTAAVIDMSGMFYGATAFNQDISGWNTAAVTNMNSMFRDAAAFNQNLETWNISAITSSANLENCFNGSAVIQTFSDSIGVGTWFATCQALAFAPITGFYTDGTDYSAGGVLGKQPVLQT